MKTLLLIRHAKAEPPAAGVVDHDRTLAERGRRMRRDGQATRVAELKPNLMISSTAARAAATARLIGDELGLAPKGITEDSRLYASSVNKMLYLIQSSMTTWIA
jgi:phosphohistidine phosphatase